MNFPVGSVAMKGEVPFDLFAVAESLSAKKFNGYVIQSVKGNFIEEGVLFFRDGLLVACVVECLSAKKYFRSSEALDFFLNQTKGSGFFQVVELSRSQIDLIVAFDEKILLPKIDLKALPKMIPNAFSPRFERSVTRRDALESYGLGEIK